MHRAINKGAFVPSYGDVPETKNKKDDTEYSGSAGEEWKELGGSFGKRMGRYENNMGRYGDKFGRHTERKGMQWENAWMGRWLGTLGFIGPFAGSIIGIISFAIGAWLVNLFGLMFKSAFILSLAGFMFANLQWFFLAFMFFGYSDYVGRRYPDTHWIFSPVIASVGSIIVVWISVLLLDLINIFAKSGLITTASNFLSANLIGLFVLVLVLGYALKIIHKLIMSSFVRAEQVSC